MLRDRKLVRVDGLAFELLVCSGHHLAIIRVHTRAGESRRYLRRSIERVDYARERLSERKGVDGVTDVEHAGIKRGL